MGVVGVEGGVVVDLAVVSLLALVFFAALVATLLAITGMLGWPKHPQWRQWCNDGTAPKWSLFIMVTAWAILKLWLAGVRAG